MAEVAPGDQLPAITKEVTQRMIDAWAEVSGDFNPLHTDLEYASQSRFGGTIAHGHLSLGWLCQLVLEWRGVTWLSGGALRNVRFVAPIRPGHTYRVEGSVAQITDDSEGRQCHMELVIIDADTSEPCVLGVATAPLG